MQVVSPTQPRLARAFSAHPASFQYLPHRRVIHRKFATDDAILDCAGIPVQLNSWSLKRSATEGPPDMERRKVEEVDKGNKMPAGLEALLCNLGLAAHVDKAEAWCQQSGAAFLEEVYENRLEFADELNLSDEERSRFLKLPEDQFTAPAIANNIQSNNTSHLMSSCFTRNATVHEHGSPCVVSAVSVTPVTSSNLARTCTVPVTDKEQKIAESKVTSAYIPLKAWQNLQQGHSPLASAPSLMPTFSTSSSGSNMSVNLYGQDEVPQSNRQILRSGPNFYRKRDWSPPRYRITDPETWKAIRTSIPSNSELHAVQNAQQRLSDSLEEVEPGARMNSALTTHTPLNASDTFTGLQHNFMREYGKDIREELPNVQLQPAQLAPAVQNTFLASLDSHVTVQAAYHGTKAQNIAPILSNGLLVPGHGGVTVANGSAHGVGIYTAKLGNASLSRGFCDSDSFLVCAVADDATTPPAGQPKQLAQQVQRRKWTGSGPGGSKNHRVTRKSGMQGAPSSAQVRMMGNHQLHQESANVRHVGSAMVVFDERRVAPLFVAKNIGHWSASRLVTNTDPMAGGNQSLKGKALPGGGFRAGRQQVVVGDEKMWETPEAWHYKKATELRRRIEGKQRDITRQACRDAKISGEAARSQ